MVAKYASKIQISLVDLDQLAGLGSRLAALLTESEQDAAAAARSPLERHRRVACRAALRLILAKAVDRPPASLRFAFGPFGKPTLYDFDRLHFNLSHSRELAAIAVTQIAPVGIDIEHIVHATDELVDGALSRLERASLVHHDPRDRDRAFTRLWVRKEAVLKASGLGLSVDPRALSLPDADSPDSLESPLPDALAASAPWSVADIPMTEAVRGAIATRTATPPPYAIRREDALLLINDFGN